MNLEKVEQFKVNFNGEDLEIEIGKMAEMATAAVTARWGETCLLYTSPSPRD